MSWPFIYRSYHHYVIHVDLDSEEQIPQIKKIIGDRSNVEFIKDRFHGKWGDISLVYMEIASIARLIDQGKFN